MRRLVTLALLALALACSTSPCQDLGERICACNPGATTDACQTQTESQLEDHDPGDGYCEDHLRTCNAPEGAVFCEWLLTDGGKVACGLTPVTP